MDRVRASPWRVINLLSTDSLISQLNPWHKEHCTLHWMVVRITGMIASVLVVSFNIPSDTTEREAFFEGLHQRLLDT